MIFDLSSCMGESFPSPDGIPSRQSRLGPFLWFVQNRWEKFLGIMGGVWQLVCSQGEAWLVKYWAVHKGCKQTLPAFNYNKLLIGFGSAVLIGVKTNWSPIIACPDLTTSSRDQSINKASLVAIMVLAVALVDVSGGRTTWWRTEVLMLSEKLDVLNAIFRRVLDNLSPLTGVLTWLIC